MHVWQCQAQYSSGMRNMASGLHLLQFLYHRKSHATARPKHAVLPSSAQWSILSVMCLLENRLRPLTR